VYQGLKLVRAGFGDEWRVVVKDRTRPSVVVGLYEILECCRRVF